MANFNIYPQKIEFATIVGVESGNPYRNTSGQFGNGPTGVKKNNEVPKGAQATPDQNEVDRKFDQIRAAARTLNSFGIDEVKNFLQAASNRELTEDEVNQLYILVRAQIVSDLVTYFSQQKKNAEINIEAEDKAIESRLDSLSPAEKSNFINRMSALGWEEKDINDLF